MTYAPPSETSATIPYTLCEMSDERFAAVKEQWTEVAGADVFSVELAALFDWTATHLAPTDGDSIALELRDDMTGDCAAIVEVVDSDRRFMSKMLKVHVSPAFWSLEGSDLVDQVARIHAATYTRVITAGLRKRVRQVKIYGRNEFMLRVLRHLHDRWELDGHGLSASMAGRWFVVTDETWTN